MVLLNELIISHFDNSVSLMTCNVMLSLVANEANMATDQMLHHISTTHTHTHTHNVKTKQASLLVKRCVDAWQLSGSTIRHFWPLLPRTTHAGLDQ